MTLYLCRWPNGHLSLVTAWDEGGGDPTEVVALGEVVERERERAVAGSDAGASGPRSTRGKEVQGVTDAPAALIRALEEQVATQRLKETEIEGPEN